MSYSSTYMPSATPPIRPYVERNREHPREMWYFLACCIAFVGLCQLLSFLLAKQSIRTGKVPGNLLPWTTARSPSLHWSRVPSAFINTYRIIAFRNTLRLGPYILNVAEIFLTCLYIIALFVWEFVKTTDETGQRYAPRYWINRAGIMAASQFPLITVLGTKNNILSLLTGIGHEKLNYIHRMTSRAVFVLVWIHAGGRLHSDIATAEWREGWIRSGLLGATTFTILIICSVRPMRTMFYEFFFYTHMFFVFVFLIAIYYHTRPSGSFHNYIWPCFLFWALDRTIRIIRLIVFNHSYFKIPKSGTFPPASEVMHAQTELISENYIRLTMKRPPHFRWAPGQTAYLIIPDVSLLPFEAHPFTISSYDAAQTDSASAGVSDDTLNSVNAYWKDVVFLINVKKGFTKRLAKIAEKGEAVKALIDGPYGSVVHLGSFDTCVFVAGESGVSYTFPLLLDTIERVRSGKSNCRRVVFIWSIRDTDHLRWISDGLYSAVLRCPPNLHLKVKIYVTGSSFADIKWDTQSDFMTIEGALIVEKMQSTPLLLSHPTVSLTYGRSVLAGLLEEEVRMTTGGRLSVSVCGSVPVVHTAREALGFSVSGPMRILRGGASITLHIESFD